MKLNCTKYSESLKTKWNKRISTALLFVIFSISEIYSQSIYNIIDYNGQTINISNSSPSCNAIFSSSNSCYNSLCGISCACAGEDYTITFYSGDTHQRLALWFGGSAYNCTGNSEIFTGDNLYIYDGKNTSSPFMHDLFSTNYYQDSIISSGSYITFHWISSTTESYWWANVVCSPIPSPPSGCNGNTPASNFCGTSPHICNLNGYCGNTSNFYTADLPGNMCEACDLFLGTIQNNSWLSFTADTTVASFNVTVSNCTKGLGLQLGVYSGNDCDNFNIISDPELTGSGTTTVNTIFTVYLPFGSAPSLLKGQDYYIMVDGKNADVCDYTIQALSGVFVVSAGNDQTICSGGSAQLQATGGKKYLWSPSASLSNAGISNPVASPSVTTIYYVTVTGGSIQCPLTSVDSVTVFVSPLDVNISGNTSICKGSSTDLTASGADTYTWSPATGLNTTTGNRVTASPATTTTYTVKCINNEGCSVTKTIVINVSNSTIALNVTPNPANICTGDSVTLTISGTSNYTWSPAAGLNSINGISVIAKPSANTTYTVTGPNQNGCLTLGTVIVNILPLPVISVSPNPVFMCSGSSASMSASGASVYTWSPSAGLSSVTGSNLIVNTSADETYTVVGIDNSGCKDSTQVEVIIEQKLNIVITPDTATICRGKTVMLTAGGANTYHWSPIDGLNTTTGDAVAASPDETMIYTVTGSDNGCSNTATATVTVIPASDVTLLIQPTVAIISEPLINFNFSSSGASPAVYWRWTLGVGDTTSISQSFSYAYKKTGRYLVTLIVVNDNGCKDSLSEYVLINPENFIYVPNAFNPNGKNRIFYVYAEGISDFRMTIFSRWGEKVFESDNINTGWNGMVKNILAPPDVYTYRLQYKDAFNKQRIKYGEITLLK